MVSRDGDPANPLRAAVDRKGIVLLTVEEGTPGKDARVFRIRQHQHAGHGRTKPRPLLHNRDRHLNTLYGIVTRTLIGRIRRAGLTHDSR